MGAKAAVVDFDTPPIDTTVKRYYVLKTNGIANIRSINMSLGAAPEVPSFWMPGYMVPRKLRNTTVLRKQFLFYDYTFVALYDPLAFEEFLTERKIPAYFLYVTGTKIPTALSEEDIQRIKQLESFKQLEVENFEAPGLRVGTLIEVCNGPFIGCKGTVIELLRGHAVLEMNVFGRPTRVNVGLEFLTGVLRSYEPEVEAPPTDEQ
jgi:transcription antitermination factor NusG